MRRKSRLQMLSRLLIYKYGTRFSIIFLSKIFFKKMKKRDTSSFLVPRNCMDFLILSVALTDKKTGADNCSVPVQINCVSADYLTSSYLIRIGYQLFGNSWYRFGTKMGLFPLI